MSAVEREARLARKRELERARRATPEGKALRAAQYRAYYAADPEKLRARARAYYAAHPEKTRARSIARYAADPEKALAQQRARYAANPEKKLAQQRAARSKRKASHHGAPEVKSGQPGVCEICRRHVHRLDLDHDHVTRRFCGWLCRNCNTGLGKFLEDPPLLLEAIRYLARTGKTSKAN